MLLLGNTHSQRIWDKNLWNYISIGYFKLLCKPRKLIEPVKHNQQGGGISGWIETRHKGISQESTSMTAAKTPKDSGHVA